MILLLKKTEFVENDNSYWCHDFCHTFNSPKSRTVRPDYGKGTSEIDERLKPETREKGLLGLPGSADVIVTIDATLPTLSESRVTPTGLLFVCLCACVCPNRLQTSSRHSTVRSEIT